MLLGLRTVIYAAPDLDGARTWYSALLALEPYFNEKFYVGFNVGGYELGLDPNAATPPRAGGATAYWGVESLDAAVARAVSQDAVVLSAPQDVGEGIRVATVADPFGNIIGLIENPHFKLAPEE